MWMVLCVHISAGCIAYLCYDRHVSIMLNTADVFPIFCWVVAEAVLIVPLIFAIRWLQHNHIYSCCEMSVMCHQSTVSLVKYGLITELMLMSGHLSVRTPFLFLFIECPLLWETNVSVILLSCQQVTMPDWMINVYKQLVQRYLFKSGITYFIIWP